MQELPLRPFHELNSALFRAEGGWHVPAGYGPVDVEVSAVRGGAAMIDLGDRVKVAVRGSDRTSFLDGLVTADLKVLDPGSLAYGLVLTDKSRVVGDLMIYALEDAFILDVEGSQAGPLLAYIQKFLVSDDVVLEDMTPAAHLEVHGPDAPAVLTQALGQDVRSMPEGRFIRFVTGKRAQGIISRISGFGVPGFAVWATASSLDAQWSALARRGTTPFGRDAYNVLRIEAGRPRVGADMSEDTLALEVAPAGAISFTKGCYVGQEIVARGTYRGHMNRKLLGLQVDGDLPPERGDRVRTVAGDVGAVTSGAWSPTLRRFVALALLRVDSVTPTTGLFVDRGGWDLRATLRPLPFVRPST